MGSMAERRHSLEGREINLRKANERRAAEVAGMVMIKPELAVEARRMISAAAECAQQACAKAGGGFVEEADALLDIWRRMEAEAEERETSIHHLRREEQQLLEHQEELATELREAESQSSWTGISHLLTTSEHAASLRTHEHPMCQDAHLW